MAILNFPNTGLVANVTQYIGDNGTTYTWDGVKWVGRSTGVLAGAQIQSDWTQATGTALDFIKNKPTLATVATSGSYADLINKPALFSGSYTDLSNRPNLAGTYQFSVAADDSTQRVISTDEVVKFIGAGGITTASDTEGNITITGSGGAGATNKLVNGVNEVVLGTTGTLTLANAATISGVDVGFSYTAPTSGPGGIAVQLNSLTVGIPNPTWAAAILANLSDYHLDFNGGPSNVAIGGITGPASGTNVYTLTGTWAANATGFPITIASDVYEANGITKITSADGVQVSTTGGDWAFGADGMLTLPGDGYGIMFDTTSESQIVTAMGGIRVYSPGVSLFLTESGNSDNVLQGYSFSSEDNGQFRVPDDSVIQAESVMSGGDGNISIQTATTTTWTFGVDGTLTVPGDVQTETSLAVTTNHILYYSNQFSGSQSISLANNASLRLGDATAWTIEAWVYITAYPASGTMTIIEKDAQVGVNYQTYMINIASNGKAAVYTGSGGGGDNNPTGKSVVSSTNLPLSQWVHLAAVWDGANITLYQNGVSVGTVAAVTTPITGEGNRVVNIGREDYLNYFTGKISNLRIVKNTAVYTGAFTPPALPLTSVINTSLLTCNAQTINVGTGTATVVNESPFGVNGDKTWTFGIDGTTVFPDAKIKGYVFTATNAITNYIPQQSQFFYTDNNIIRLVQAGWYIKGPGLVGWKQITSVQDNSTLALIMRIGSGNTPLGDGSEFPAGGGNVYTISQYLDFDLQVADKTWTFNQAGSISLPAGGEISEGGGLTGAIKLTPAGGANAYQALVIYPTATGDGDHLHLTAGGGTTELYLGNDFHYVKLVDGGNIEVRATHPDTSTAAWTFDTDGNIDTRQALGIKVPNGVPSSVTNISMTTGSWELNPRSNLATTGGSGSGLTVTVTQAGGYVNAIAIATAGTGYTAGDVITVTSGTSSAAFIIAVAGRNTWLFGEDGNLTAPGNLQVDGGKIILNTGDNAYIESVDYGVNTANSAVNIFGGPYQKIKLRAGFGTQATWTFGTDGSLTFPDASVQTKAWAGIPGPYADDAAAATAGVAVNYPYHKTGTSGQVFVRLT